MTSKVHIVYCHPSEKSITNTLNKDILKDYKKKYSVPITDLYNSNFNLDITEEEYLIENYNFMCKYCKVSNL